MSPVQPILASLPAVAGAAGTFRGRAAARRDADAGVAAFALALAPVPSPQPAPVTTPAVPAGDVMATAAGTTSPAGDVMTTATGATSPAGPRPAVAAAGLPAPVHGRPATAVPPSPDDASDDRAPRGPRAALVKSAAAVPAGRVVGTPAPPATPGPVPSAPPAHAAPIAAAVATVAAAVPDAAPAPRPRPAREAPATRGEESVPARSGAGQTVRVSVAAARPTGAGADTGEPGEGRREPAVAGRARVRSAPVGDEAPAPSTGTASPSAPVPPPEAVVTAPRPAAANVADAPTAAAGAPRTAEPATKPAAPVGQVTLSFSGEEGLEGRLRIALRGNVVRATIVARDPEEARALESSLGELRSALGERGFPDARLAVQGTVESRAGETRPDRDGQHARQQEDHAGHPDGRRDGDLDSSRGNPRRRSSRRQAER